MATFESFASRIAIDDDSDRHLLKHFIDDLSFRLVLPDSYRSDKTVDLISTRDLLVNLAYQHLSCPYVLHAILGLAATDLKQTDAALGAESTFTAKEDYHYHIMSTLLNSEHNFDFSYEAIALGTLLFTLSETVTIFNDSKNSRHERFLFDPRLDVQDHVSVRFFFSHICFLEVVRTIEQLKPEERLESVRQVLHILSGTRQSWLYDIDLPPNMPGFRQAADELGVLSSAFALLGRVTSLRKAVSKRNDENSAEVLPIILEAMAIERLLLQPSQFRPSPKHEVERLYERCVYLHLAASLDLPWVEDYLTAAAETAIENYHSVKNICNLQAGPLFPLFLLAISVSGEGIEVELLKNFDTLALESGEQNNEAFLARAVVVKLISSRRIRNKPSPNWESILQDEMRRFSYESPAQPCQS